MDLAMLQICSLLLVANGLSFDGLFTGGAVLQQGVEVAVYGKSQAKEVTLSLDGRIVSKAAVSQGSWTAYLPAQSSSWRRTLRADDGTASASTEVSFGAVLLCSGQSNMDMPVYVDGGFSAFNGSAEVAAAGRYTDKIWLATVQDKGAKGWNGTGCGQGSPPTCVNNLVWNKVTPDTLEKFSAVCWYAGKALFERLGGEVPVGLMKGSVGGSPIEFWLPAGHVNNSVCGVDDPPCDNKKFSDSDFYDFYIAPLAPYTLGAVIWDQGERDVHCFAPATNHTAVYPCLEKELIWSWRHKFNSTFAFVAVQLPGYIGDCDAPGANPDSSYYNCVPGVFEMRLAQELGTNMYSDATVVATYDLGCPFGVKTEECPWGSVHNIRKTAIGERVADELRRLLFAEALVSEGPRAASAQAVAGSGSVEVTVDFAGGSTPFYLDGTQHCDACCGTGVGDFDASPDGGATWINATSPHRMAGATSVAFTVSAPRVTHVRYTANQAFPQCAVYNQEGLPALPFMMQVSSFLEQVV